LGRNSYSEVLGRRLFQKRARKGFLSLFLKERLLKGPKAEGKTF